MLITVDQIQDRNVCFSQIIRDLNFFLWALSAVKKIVCPLVSAGRVSYNQLPAILGMVFVICPALVPAFLLFSTSSPALFKVCWDWLNGLWTGCQTGWFGPFSLWFLWKLWSTGVLNLTLLVSYCHKNHLCALCLSIPIWKTWILFSSFRHHAY